MNMDHQNMAARIASQDFERARRKAFFRDVFSTLRGTPNWLLSFEEVQRALPVKEQHYRGMQQVLVAQIVGSVDRYRDFDRGFLPTQSRTRPRWESIDRANLTDVPLPPVQLYKVGDAYFVKDGNHRVSVARETGVMYIDAEVIECATTVPISADTDPRELLSLAEYARFLEATRLDKLREGVNLRFTTLGRYDVLLEHITAHRWFMGIEQNRPIEWEEAVLHWYDDVYSPLVQIIEENRILADFPGHTTGDLYLWIMDYRWYLHQDVGEEVGPETAAHSYSVKYAPWTRKVLRSLHRLQTAATRPLVITAQALSRAISTGDDNSP